MGAREDYGVHCVASMEEVRCYTIPSQGRDLWEAGNEVRVHLGDLGKVFISSLDTRNNVFPVVLEMVYRMNYVWISFNKMGILELVRLVHAASWSPEHNGFPFPENKVNQPSPK